MKVSYIPKAQKTFPFPSPIRIGTDICKITRIRNLVVKDHASFIRRVLTPREIHAHSSRLTIPEIIKPITRDGERSYVPVGEKVEILPLPAQSVYDGEGNYILTTQECNSVHGQMFSDNKTASSYVWPKYTDKELETIENHAKMSDLELAGKILENRQKRREKLDRKAVVEFPAEDTAKELAFVTELQEKKQALSENPILENHLALLAFQRSVRAKLYFQKMKQRELESSNEEGPEAKKRELEGMARNIRQTREEQKLLAREEDVTKVATFLSGRWAAKEAITKAHKHRRVTFHDIEIHTRSKSETDTGSLAPVAVVKSEEGDKHPYREVQVSISHDGGYATATALVCEPSPAN